MTAVSEDQLIGQHNEIVDGLLEEYARIRSGQPGPSVFILNAPSGYGKSRIIREFYERIRNPVEGKPYWPSLVREQRPDTRSLGVDPLPDRKVLGPAPEAFVWEEGALPEFGWWNFNCELMATGRAMDLVGAAGPQLTAHSVPLRIAQDHLRGAKGKLTGPVLSKFIHRFREALNGEADGEIGDWIDEVVGSVPGLGIWVDMSAWGITTARQGMAKKRRLRSQVDVGAEIRAGDKEKGKELADLVFDLSSAKLPAVVVIEDAHRLSAEFLVFLRALRTADAERPLMVLATAWPEGLTNTAYSRWVEEEEAAQTLVSIRVPELKQAEISRIIQSFRPDLISIDTAHALASRMKTPYVAKLWMTTPSVERELAAATPSTDLAQKLLSMPVPRDIKEIYENRWRELPPDVRQALVLATSASTINEPLARFVPRVVARAAEHIGHDRRATQGALADAIEPHSWCVMEGAAEVLREELMTQVAREGREMVTVTDSELTKFRDHVSEESARLLEERSADQRQGSATEESRILMARSVLEQQPGTSGNETASTASARLVLAAAALSAGEDILAASTLRPVLSWSGAEKTEVGMACLGLYAESVATEDIDSAVRVSDRRVAGARGVYGKDAPEYWDVLIDDLELRSMSAFGIQAKKPAAEDISAVLQDHRRLIDDVASTLGRDSKQHLLASRNFAMSLLDAGDRVASVEAFRRFLIPMEQKFGALDHRTLDAKTEFVMATGRDASSTEMLPFIQELLRDLRSEFGDGDFRTIDIRRQEIFWRLRTPAQREGLLPMIEDLIVDSATFRGPSSFATLDARAARSIYLSRTDAPDRGAQEAEKLVAQARQIYGTKSGAYYYFNQIFKNAQSYARPKAPALDGEIRFKSVATGHAEGWKPVTPESIARARTLYAALEGTPPEPTAEAMRSKLMKEHFASIAAVGQEAITEVGPGTGLKPGRSVSATSSERVTRPINKADAPAKPVVAKADVPAKPTVPKANPSVKPSPARMDLPTKPAFAKKSTTPVGLRKPAQKDGHVPNMGPAAHQQTPPPPSTAPPASMPSVVTPPARKAPPASRKKRKPRLIFAAILVAAVLAWACFLLLTTEGANLPGRTVFSIAGLLALFGHASTKLKPFLLVSVLVAIGVLSAVPGFPGSSTPDAGVDWLAVVLGAAGPFAFVVIRRLRRRSSADSAASRGKAEAGRQSPPS